MGTWIEVNEFGEKPSAALSFLLYAPFLRYAAPCIQSFFELIIDRACYGIVLDT